MPQQMMKKYTDKLMFAKILNGLDAFAEQRTAEGAKDSEIVLVRKIIKEMSNYWEMELSKDWFQEFDQRIQQIQQAKQPQEISMSNKVATLYGLAGYSEEMMHTHGNDEQGRQEEIQQVMQRMEQVWNI